MLVNNLINPLSNAALEQCDETEVTTISQNAYPVVNSHQQTETTSHTQETKPQSCVPLYNLPPAIRPIVVIESYQRYGYPLMPLITLIIFIIALFVAFYRGGLVSISLLISSLLPVFIVFLLMKARCGETIPTCLMLEMFWIGALFSIATASILELFSETQTRLIWECQQKHPSISCDIRFAIVVLVGVGFVEEFSKFLPLTRFRISEKHFPTHHQWFFRLIDTPQTLALCGLTAALGFAGIENIKYVFNSGPAGGLATSLWRAILAIPLHLACTLYSACQLAKLWFGSKSRSSLIRPFTAYYGPHFDSSFLNDDIIIETGTNAFMSFLQYLWCISVPSIIHGFYDTGLFLAVQLASLSKKQTILLCFSSIFTHYPIDMHTRGTNTTETILPYNETTFLSQEEPDDLYNILGAIFLGIAFICYLLMIILSIQAYKNLKSILICPLTQQRIQDDYSINLQSVSNDPLYTHWNIPDPYYYVPSYADVAQYQTVLPSNPLSYTTTPTIQIGTPPSHSREQISD